MPRALADRRHALCQYPGGHDALRSSLWQNTPGIFYTTLAGGRCGVRWLQECQRNKEAGSAQVTLTRKSCSKASH